MMNKNNDKIVVSSICKDYLKGYVKDSKAKYGKQPKQGARTNEQGKTQT